MWGTRECLSRGGIVKPKRPISTCFPGAYPTVYRNRGLFWEDPEPCGIKNSEYDRKRVPEADIRAHFGPGLAGSYARVGLS